MAAGRGGRSRERGLVALTSARCPDCDRDLERGERERYFCLQCGRQWLRIGLIFEPDDPVPVARVVGGGASIATHSLGNRGACCGAILDDAGWEKFACAACGKRYVRVGIQLVPE